MSPIPSTDHYIAAVNRAIDVARQDVSGDLRLARLAGEAGFSPFHFHRVFKSVTGETLTEFVGRVRLERAVRMMRHGASSLTTIAAACGFGTPSSFSRAFRTRYGIPPSAFDPHVHVYQRERPPSGASIGNVSFFDVAVRTQEGRTVIYNRVTDPYTPGRLAAGVRALADWVDTTSTQTGTWIGYSWDDPDIVAKRKCRYDIAVEVDPRASTTGFATMSFPPTLVAEIDVSGAVEREQSALDWLFSHWLPTSGFVPADMPLFEVWHGHPAAMSPDRLELTIQLPLERLTRSVPR